MVAPGSRGDPARMARLLVLWTRPHHLDAEEARAWAQAVAAELAALETVERAALTPLGSPAECHPCGWNWLLALDLAPDADPEAWVQAPSCRECLADLRGLGTRPVVMVADDDVPVPAGVG